MAITLTDDAKKQALSSIKRFCAAELDFDTSDIQAVGLYNYFLTEIGPAVYNKGVSDAQAYLRDRLADLEGVCYEPEFPFWPKGSSVRRKT